MKYDSAMITKTSLTVKEPKYSSMHVREATMKWRTVKIVFSIFGAKGSTSSLGTMPAVVRR